MPRRSALRREPTGAFDGGELGEIPSAELLAYGSEDVPFEDDDPGQGAAPSGYERGESDSSDLPAEIPLPPASPSESSGRAGLGSVGRPGAESSGRVLGRGRAAAQVPSHLAPYQQTIVIGGDPRREPPVEAPSAPAELEQTMAAPAAPVAPPPPAIDQEILAKAQMEAQQLMQQAQMQAQQLLADAQANIATQAEQLAEQAKQQGYQDGMQQGFAAGQEQGMAETVSRIEQLKLEFVELVMARRKVLAAMEGEVVHLAVNIAEKIVGMELATGREIITGIVRQALATLKERDEVVVRVNPAEVEAITANQAAYEAMIEGLKRFEVVSDGAIEVGSCSIETSLGNVDARIATQLEAVRAGLDEMVKIRAFEMKDKLASEPVEVPGDPEFHARILQAEADAAAAEAAAKAHH